MKLTIKEDFNFNTRLRSGKKQCLVLFSSRSESSKSHIFIAFSQLFHFSPIFPYSNIFYHVLPYFTMFYHILPYPSIFYHILPYSIISYHILSYSAMFYHYLPYSCIFYHISLIFNISKPSLYQCQFDFHEGGNPIKFKVFS